MWIPGYLAPAEAMAEGFTHHGKYFGVPIWVGDVDNADGGLLVAAKWAPLEYLLPTIHAIEGLLATFLFPDAEPGFQLWIGAPIEPPAAGCDGVP